MSIRVLALVGRSGGGTQVTDRTPCIVFEHEIPLLEEIHGEGSVEVIDDNNDLLDKEIRKDRASQIEHIVKVNRLGEKFDGDPKEEYDRMAMKYGQHIEVRMSNVEKVYGSFGQGRFTQACGVISYEEMTMAELKKACEELGIEVKPSDKKATLINILRDEKETA